MENIIDLISFAENNIYINYGLIFLIFGTYIIKLKILNIKIKKEFSEEILKQKNFFVETLKHDISVPTIAQLRGIELLKKDLIFLKNEQKEILNEIEKSCIESLNLIQMLLLGQYSEKYNMKPEVFNLIMLIKECLSEIKEETLNKNIKISTNSELNCLYINADKIYIKKVIKNLILRAVINSKRNKTIYIEAKTNKNRILLYINSDNNFLSQYTTVGEKIKMSFCKKIIEDNHGIINSNTNKSLGFEIPQISCSYIQ